MDAPDFGALALVWIQLPGAPGQSGSGAPATGAGEELLGSLTGCINAILQQRSELLASQTLPAEDALDSPSAGVPGLRQSLP